MFERISKKDLRDPETIREQAKKIKELEGKSFPDLIKTASKTKIEKLKKEYGLNGYS